MTYGSDVLPFDDEDADADADKDVEVERKVAAESRISSSKEDDQEEHVDYANYFWLRLLLLASAIDHNLTPNPKFQLLNKCVNCLVAVVFGMELVHIMYIQIKTQTVYYVPIGMVLWVFHSVIVFTVVSSSMRKKLSLLTIIPELVKEEPASLRPVSLQNVPKMIRADGICTFCVCFVNVLITAFNWNLIWEALPLSTHISYILSLCFVHYIYSICWFLAVPFLHVSCYIMTKKIENFKEFLEEAVMENRPLDIRHVMQWYKELYNSNKKLSSLISPLMTTSFILIGMLIVVMLMSLFDARDDTNVMVVLVWLVSNAFLLATMAYRVCTIEDQNVYIWVAIAEIESCPSRPEDLPFFQLAQGQVKELCFGVNFSGSHVLITYDLVWKGVSYISSFFLFLYGVTVSGAGSLK